MIRLVFVIEGGRRRVTEEELIRTSIVGERSETYLARVDGILGRGLGEHNRSGLVWRGFGWYENVFQAKHISKEEILQRQWLSAKPCL